MYRAGKCGSKNTIKVKRMKPESTLIIAEAGVNHNGDLAIGKKLINIAAEAGADLVKFQTFAADRLVARSA